MFNLALINLHTTFEHFYDYVVDSLITALTNISIWMRTTKKVGNKNFDWVKYLRLQPCKTKYINRNHLFYFIE